MFDFFIRFLSFNVHEGVPLDGTTRELYQFIFKEIARTLLI